MSEIFERQISAYCVKMRGGTLRFQAQYIRKCRFPAPESVPADVTSELLYHLVWSVGAVRDPVGFVEPFEEVGWDQFSADLRSGFAEGQPTIPEHP